jgi:hypothetical protein
MEGKMATIFVVLVAIMVIGHAILYIYSCPLGNEAK